MVSPVDVRWYERFEALKQYLEIYGEEPSKKTEFQGVDVGTWLAAQRVAFRKDELPSDCVRMIDELGILLSKRSSERHAHFEWEKWLKACIVFRDSTGHLPGVGDTNEWGFKIGQWLSNQRRNCREGKLSQDRLARLQTVLGSAWGPWSNRWNENLAAYKDYVEKTGQQPKKFTMHNNTRIGLWLYRLRGDPRSLSKAQIDVLNAVGMRWIRNPSDPSAPLTPSNLRKQFAKQTEDEWLAYYKAYRTLVTELSTNSRSRPNPLNVDSTGDREATRSISEEYLEIWLSVQKRLYHGNELAEERRLLIDKLMSFILETRAI